MPAKKSAPARFSSNDWAKWVYLIGVIVAGLAGAFARFIIPFSHIWIGSCFSPEFCLGFSS